MEAGTCPVASRWGALSRFIHTLADARRSVFLAGMAAALALGAPHAPAADTSPESSDPIILAVHDWLGQQLVTYAAGAVLERAGYSVHYVNAGAYAAAIGLADGTLSAALEVWESNLGEHYETLIAEGRIERLGSLGLDAREGLLYTAAAKRVCPGLPGWDAFVACAPQLTTAETAPRGRILDYPLEWGTRAADLVNAEGLPFVAVPSGSEEAMLAELAATVARDEPLVMTFWAPHWALVEHEHGWVEVPAEAARRHGFRRTAVFKALWPGVREKWPGAYRLLAEFRMDNDSQGRLSIRVRAGEGDARSVARAWSDARASAGASRAPAPVDR